MSPLFRVSIQFILFSSISLSAIFSLWAKAGECSVELSVAGVLTEPPQLPQGSRIGRLAAEFLPVPEISLDEANWNSVYAQVFMLPLWQRSAAVLAMLYTLGKISHVEALRLVNLVPSAERRRLRLHLRGILETELSDYSLIDQMNIMDQWPELVAEEPLVISSPKEMGQLVAYNQRLLASLLGRKLILVEPAALDSDGWQVSQIESNLAGALILSADPSQRWPIEEGLMHCCEVKDAQGLKRFEEMPFNVRASEWTVDSLIERMQKVGFIDSSLIRLVRSYDPLQVGNHVVFAFAALRAVIETPGTQSFAMAKLALRVNNFNALLGFVKSIRTSRIFDRSQITGDTEIDADLLSSLAFSVVRGRFNVRYPIELIVNIDNPYAREAFITIALSRSFYSYRLLNLASTVTNSYQMEALMLVERTHAFQSYRLAALVVEHVHSESQLKKLRDYYSIRDDRTYSTLRELLR